MTSLNRTHDEMNEAIRKEITSTFDGRRVEGKKKTLVYSNVKPQKADTSFKLLASAINSGKTVSQKYKADVSILDNETGKVLSEKKGAYIGEVPMYTKKGGFVVDGNTYNLPNQIRLKPGAYTLNKANGDVETMMNVKNGRGMKIVSPQDKDDVKIEIGSRQFSPVDVAKILGATDKEIDSTIGKDLATHLRKKSDLEGTALKLSQTLGLTGPDITPPHSEVSKGLREYFEKTELDKSVTQHTLGKPVVSVDKDAILLGVKRNVAVKRGSEPEDDKENLMFKRIITPEKLMAEGIQRDLMKPEAKMKGILNNPFEHTDVSEVLKEPTLKHAAKAFLTTSAISRMPEEYNPLQTLQGSSDITPMGEGGITSTEMITPSVRSLHLSQLGFIDPIKSPEGANTGVTLSTTLGSYVDKDGNAALKVKNLKTGKQEIKTVGDLWDKRIAFPNAKKNGDVGIRHRSDVTVGGIKTADYQMTHAEDMYGPAMNALGIISSNDPTRNLMASKHVLQALPIEHPDVNPVSLMGSDGKSLLATVAKSHIPTAKFGGTVQRVDTRAGKIQYKSHDGKIHTEDYAVDSLQLNTKTSIKHTPIVKAGDKVIEGQALADSNFTKGGQLAIGKNLRTAWMMYPGTRNDAFIISDKAAKDLTSVHSSKFDIDGTKGTILDKRKFASMFPEVVKKLDLSKYDDRGIIKSGETVAKDEPISLGMRKMDPSEVRFANDKVKKLLYGGMAPIIQKWKGDNSGVIKTITTTGAQHRVIAEYKAPMQIGDKIAGRSGNKGIISAIIPEKDMPHDEHGVPVDAILGGAGVISRRNPAQITEATLTEVAKKTGKPYVLPHFSDNDLSEFAVNEAKKNKVKLYHKVYDPIRKKHLKQEVFIADYNLMKLFKQGEGTYSATGHGPVDALNQPKKGGKESAASVSNMEINALLSHNARDFLREVGTVKSQRNQKWFAAFEAGGIPPAPETKSARDNFHGLLNQMNIKVTEDGTSKHILPMTDSDVLKKSSGAVTEPFGLKRNTMEAVDGGFYDTKVFGGHGQNYGHIDLKTRIINPLYKKPVAAVMGLTEKGLEDKLVKDGMDDIYKRISGAGIKSTIGRLKTEIKSTKDQSKIDRTMKAIKSLKKIDSLGENPADVMLLSKIPVLPIKMRPPSKMPDGSIIEHDVNNHYANITRAANALNSAEVKDMPVEIRNRLKNELQQHVGAMYGTNVSPDPKMVRKETKSVMDIVSGANPKNSFWHQKILKNKVFGSGRAVIVPHTKSLSMDQVEIPKAVAWNAYKPHIVRKMSQMGIANDVSKEMIDNKTETATNVLNQVMKEVPLVINRAPALHKHNMTGHYASISGGNVMHIPPEIENGQNADYDGDQLAIHVPFGQAAIKDVKTRLMASKQLFNNAQKGGLTMGIDLDPFIGYYDATKGGKK